MKTLQLNEMENVSGGLFGIGGQYAACVDVALGTIGGLAAEMSLFGVAMGVVSFAYAYEAAPACGAAF